MVGAERRSVEAERPTDMGPSQVHLARCAESLGEEQVLLDREPLSLQRPPAGVRQGRGGEGETTADVGATLRQRASLDGIPYSALGLGQLCTPEHASLDPFVGATLGPRVNRTIKHREATQPIPKGLAGESPTTVRPQPPDP